MLAAPNSAEPGQGEAQRSTSGLKAKISAISVTTRKVVGAMDLNTLMLSSSDGASHKGWRFIEDIK